MGNNQQTINGASFYAKYRFYLDDDIHKHFRISAFSKIALIKMESYQAAIDLFENNSGAEVGVVATALLNVAALSSSISVVNAFNKKLADRYILYNFSNKAFAYSISCGRLFLPKEYINYNQVNVNGMVEFLGQTNFYSANTFLDIAPSVQFIFLSKIRLDVGYRFPIVNTLYRQNSNSFLVRLEYNIFNAFK